MFIWKGWLKSHPFFVIDPLKIARIDKEPFHWSVENQAYVIYTIFSRKTVTLHRLNVWTFSENKYSLKDKNMKAYILKSRFIALVVTMLSAGNLMAYTAVADGDWTNPATWGGVAPSGTVSNQDIIIPSGIDVNRNTDATFSGLVNSFTVDGTLTSSTNRELTIQLGTLNGSVDISLQRIVFDGVLVTYSHSGANGTFEISRTGVSRLSPFSVADMSAELSVDDETALLNINLYPNPCADELNIDYVTTSGDQFTYEITDVAGKSYAVVRNGSNQMDVSALSKGAYFLRMTNTKTITWLSDSLLRNNLISNMRIPPGAIREGFFVVLHQKRKKRTTVTDTSWLS